MKNKLIAGIVLIIYFLSMILNLYPVYAESEGVNTNNYVLFPNEIEVIDGIGTGTISLAEEVSEYAIAYQKMVLEEAQYNTIIGLIQTIQNHTEYIETDILPQLTGEWIEIEKTANNLHLDFKNYSGTIYYVLLVKITDGTNTYYNINGYTNNIETTEQVESVTISETTANIKVDETLQLTATSSTNSTITWESSDDDVATVSETGLVTGIAEGTAVITATGSEKSATCTVTVGPKETTGTEDNEDGEWTDFSNAKFELKKFGFSDAILEISNVLPNDGSEYYLIITNNSNKPNESNDEFRQQISFDEKSKLFIAGGMEYFVELNQDIYISILERQSRDNENIVIYGKKIEKYAEPKYSDAFTTSWMASDLTDIDTCFTHSDEIDRKIQIKVGKITDISILQKIKNEDASGFAELLAFAKENNGIFNEVLSSEQDIIGYKAYKDEGVINLSDLENDEYYFLYLKTDDENGMYTSHEAITFGRCSGVSGSSMWNVMFYGDADFEWADFGKVEDDTKAPVVLPNTGIGKYIAIISVLAVVVTVSYIQIKKMKEIR